MKTQFRTGVFILLVCCFLGTGSALFAEKVGGVTLPDTFLAGGTPLQLNGAGLRMKVIIKVYAGGLYLKSPSSDVSGIIEADEPMAIKLHFVRNVDNKSIIDAWNEGFVNSAGSGYGTAQDKIDQFNSCFSTDVKKNGVYDIVYVPGQGTSVSIDGVKKVQIRGLDFKKAVFAIWLGDKPADEKLKEGMLGS